MAQPVLTDLDFGGTALVLGLDATEARAGVAEVATQAEVTAGTDDARIVTPKKLASFVASYLASLGIFPQAVPGYAHLPAASAPAVPLTASEQVLLTTSVTMPAGGSGRLQVSYKAQVSLGSALAGSNVMEYRVYMDPTSPGVGGTLVPGATCSRGWTIGLLGLSLSADSDPAASMDLVSGVAAGLHTFELRAVRTQTTSTATVVGARSLLVRSA